VLGFTEKYFWYFFFLTDYDSVVTLRYLDVIGVEVEDSMAVRLAIPHLARVSPELKLQGFL